MPNEVGTELIDSPSILAQWALAVGEAWGGSEPQLLAIAHDLSIQFLRSAEHGVYE
jgi:hypothetical protein